MADAGAVMSGKWVNDLLHEVVEKLDDIVGELLDVLFESGYPGGVEPVKLADLKKMGIVAALSTLQGMSAEPYEQADAAKLAAQYTAYLRGLDPAQVQAQIQQEMAAILVQSRAAAPVA